MNRRSFLGAILAASAAPAFARQGILMPVRAPRLILYADGIRDDTEAFQSWINGGRVFAPSGALIGSALVGATLSLGKTIHLTDFSVPRAVCDSNIAWGDGVSGSCMEIHRSVLGPGPVTKLFERTHFQARGEQAGFIRLPQAHADEVLA